MLILLVFVLLLVICRHFVRSIILTHNNIAVLYTLLCLLIVLANIATICRCPISFSYGLATRKLNSNRQSLHFQTEQTPTIYHTKPATCHTFAPIQHYQYNIVTDTVLQQSANQTYGQHYCTANCNGIKSAMPVANRQIRQLSLHII